MRPRDQEPLQQPQQATAEGTCTRTPSQDAFGINAIMTQPLKPRMHAHTHTSARTYARGQACPHHTCHHGHTSSMWMVSSRMWYWFFHHRSCCSRRHSVNVRLSRPRAIVTATYAQTCTGSSSAPAHVLFVHTMLPRARIQAPLAPIANGSKAHRHELGPCSLLCNAHPACNNTHNTMCSLPHTTHTASFPQRIVLPRCSTASPEFTHRNHPPSHTQQHQFTKERKHPSQ